MANIAFRGKVRTAHYVDGTTAYRYIAVPALQRHHCDMAAFRQHSRYGCLANSDLFPGVLAKIRRDLFPANYVRLDSMPANVTVDETGFLAEVIVTV